MLGIMKCSVLATVITFASFLSMEIVLGIPLDCANLKNDVVPNIISRQNWHARQPVERELLEVTPTPYVVIHHGGEPKYCYDEKTCSAIVRQYQNFHIDDRHWFDIGYSFVIGEDGNVYEGRGWDYVGAHAPGYNTQSIGICIIGDFSSKCFIVQSILKVRIECCGSYNVTKHSSSSSQSTMMEKLITVLLMLASCQVFGDVLEDHNIPVRPNIISRSNWGARAPKSQLQNLAVNPPPYVVIHHSATDGCTTQAICQARVRSFQNYHMDEKNWTDIGYNFVVGEDGNVYEGRGWDKHGAHSKPYNSKSIGICIIGNFVDHNPNTAAINATQDLIAYGTTIGKIKEQYTLLGHSQTAATSCPGKSLYKLIQTWPGWSSI
ncbi:peptidoglycan-recognition protein 1-like [Ceratina calcarata]|uniref:Peptidoglycan-recognition protein 1-like n=1 Tax=Ceratina calcarata TaxID=156304 RepID=A0AAJ7J7Q5_9HYME|nr:peptidoglycan-recognition protein 1-like [Ceratina calcarata]